MKLSLYMESMKGKDRVTQLHDWSQFSREDLKLKQTNIAIITQIEVSISKIKKSS